MVASLRRMEIGQIAPAVSGGLELAAHPGLALQQDNLICRPFRRGQRRRHARRATADDSDNHSVSFPVPVGFNHILTIILHKMVSHKKNFFSPGKRYAIMPMVIAWIEGILTKLP